MIAVNSRKNLHPVQHAVEESLYLELAFNEECKCEMTHLIGECSIKVTHLITFCTGSALMCFNGAMNRIEAMETDYCKGCGNRASECWSIRPV